MAAPCAHVCVRGPVQKAARAWPLNWVVRSHCDMERSGKLVAANVMMAVGLIPLALWLLFLANAAYYASRGNFGLSDLMITGMFGLIAYVAALLVAGGGALWAGRTMNLQPDVRHPFTRALVRATGVSLLIPWLMFVGIAAMRAVQ